MSDHSAKWLVETDWLAAHLDAPDVVVIDASWYLPGVPRNPHEEYLEARVPGAVFFDIDEICDKSSPLPHMLPSPEQFSSRMRKMGIGDGMRVIVYDTDGMFSAARVWWTFRAMGKDDVAILNGGLAKWKREGLPLEDGPPAGRTERHFTSRRNGELIRDRDDMLANSANGAEQILDARAADRFRGEAPEPREGLRAGHIPGSLNLPYPALLNDDGTLKSADALKAAFEEAGVNLAKPVATTCGSGVTASILALALAILGHRQTSVYDGSWSEWGGDDALPVATGTETGGG
ncbi:MAG: 3-mercaptopyruvate sulfurtransferase [Hyphomicrobiaceae bacterium]|nr:3-mercaptopyruvate sulfurtransferase [Hyphomicrobiaceae bacterium]